MRWHVATRGTIVTFSEDDALLIVVECHSRHIVVRVLATADGALQAERTIPRDHYIQSFHAFGCFRGRFEIDDLSLSLPALDIATRAGPSMRRIALGDRFVLVGDMLTYSLFDSVRERHVLCREAPGSAMAACGRFVFVPRHGKCVVHDLALDRVTAFAIHSAIGKAYVSRDGHRLLISNSHPELFELEWTRDPGTPRDLATAWGDHPRPPIVDTLLKKLHHTNSTELSRNHPELELALAGIQRSSEGLEATRRLLQHTTITAMPAAWAQLARMSLQLDRLDEAADAAAEALGRAPDDAALLALLDEIQRARATPRARPLEAHTQWRAHGKSASAIAVRDTEIATLGLEDDGDEWLRLWSRTGELVEQHLVGKARKSAGNRVDLGEHALSCTTDEGVVRFRRGKTAPSRVISEHAAWKCFDFGGDGIVVGVVGKTTLCWFTLAHRIAEIPIEAEASAVRLLGTDALLLYPAFEYRRATPRLERVTRHGRRTVVPARAFDLCVDGAIVYAAGEAAVHRWTSELESLPPLEGHRTPVSIVAARGELVAAIDRAGSLRWWRGERPLATSVARNVASLAITDDETTVALHGDGTVRLWPSP